MFSCWRGDVGQRPQQFSQRRASASGQRNAAYWLNKAEEARTRAAGMHNPDAIATMLDIAAKYEEMAQQAERREIRATAKATKPKSSN